MQNQQPIDALSVATAIKEVFDAFNQLLIRGEQIELSMGIKQKLVRLNHFFVEAHKNSQTTELPPVLSETVKSCNGDLPCNGAANV